MEKVIVFTLNGEFYALPVMSVKEVIKKGELNPVPNSADFIIGVMNLRGKVIPVIDLLKRFGLISEDPDSYLHIVVVESNGTMFGILVSNVSEVLTISTENIQPVPETLSKKIETQFLKGVIVDKDEKERLILYLNADTIFTVTGKVALHI